MIKLLDTAWQFLRNILFRCCNLFMDESTFNRLNEFRKRFKEMTDQELNDTREREAKKSGWTTSRSLFLTTLKEEVEARDISAKSVSDEHRIDDNDSQKTMKTINEYPKYYDVDDIPVKVDYDPIKDEVFAINWANMQWSPLKASTEGQEIDEQTFNEAVRAYQQYFVEKTIDEKEFNARISKLFGTQFFD